MTVLEGRRREDVELTKVEMAFVLSSQHRMLEEILAMMREMALELKGSLEKKHEALAKV